MQIEEGRYYIDERGRVQGPMTYSPSLSGRHWRGIGGVRFTDDGKAQISKKAERDLVAEVFPVKASAALIERLAKEYRPSMDKDVLHSWASDVVAVLSLAKPQVVLASEDEDSEPAEEWTEIPLPTAEPLVTEEETFDDPTCAASGAGCSFVYMERFKSWGCQYCGRDATEAETLELNMPEKPALYSHQRRDHILHEEARERVIERVLSVVTGEVRKIVEENIAKLGFHSGGYVKIVNSFDPGLRKDEVPAVLKNAKTYPDGGEIKPYPGIAGLGVKPFVVTKKDDAKTPLDPYIEAMEDHYKKESSNGNSE